MLAKAPFDTKIVIGRDHSGDEIDWCFTELNNFNGVFMGTSGSGKTWTLRNMIARVYNLGTVFHILDVKGDFTPENFKNQGLGHLVNDDCFNVIEFTYYDGGSSLNPLQVPKSREGGGVVMTIETTKELVRKFNPKLGQKQLGYFGEALKAVYADFGIDHEQEESWSRKAPTLQDVYEKLTLIYQCIASGLDSGSVSTIMTTIGQAKRKLVTYIKQEEEAESERDAIEVGCSDYAMKVNETIFALVKEQLSYTQLKRNGTGEEWEHWSKDSVYGLRDTIGQMVETRLFTGDASTVQPGKINLYNLTNISPAHQQIMMDIVARRTYAMGVLNTKRTGKVDPPNASHILVCDEGKHVKEISKQPLSPVNRIATEGRGFGLGVWMGVQQPDQVTQDQLRNFAFYFLMKTPETSAKEMIRMFSLKPNQLKLVQPRINCLYSSSQKYVLVEQFKGD